MTKRWDERVRFRAQRPPTLPFSKGMANASSFSREGIRRSVRITAVSVKQTELDSMGLVPVISRCPLKRSCCCARARIAWQVIF